ncbi:T9SS type A sorting domain-containing protein [Winogradskyella pacifica]|uniref:T9SS type A sorting domain-containing protein n=1 Tax=Winogradskyella pacifica TaxID=664642 RepID=UPI0015CB788F|nr:T9SS type A sorting domain-containing protein [Winogradskyella pacifica]
MKKLITAYLFFLSFCIQPIFAQFGVLGSEDYGRIFSLTYDANEPNKVYAHTLKNHILVSTDNGGSWDILYSLPIGESASIEEMKLTADGTGLSFIAITPNRPYGAIMIYNITSNEVSKTFNLPNQNLNGNAVSYSFYEGDSDILLVDTNLGQTFYTADSGLSWETVYDAQDYDAVSIFNVAISPNNPEKLFLARGMEAGLLISEDAGQTWEVKLDGVSLEAIAFDPSNTETLLIGTAGTFDSTIENLYKSTDGGETFNIVPITWTTGVLDGINTIHYNPLNPSQIIILEENEIVISRDSGATWQNIVYLEDNPLSYSFGKHASFNPQNSEEVLITSNYVPLFSTDGGETVTWLKSPNYASEGNLELYLDDENANLYYGVRFGFVHRDLNTELELEYNVLPFNYSSSNPGPTILADKITANRIFTLTPSFMGSNFEVSHDNGVTKHFLTSLYMNGFTALGTYPQANETVMVAFSGFSPSDTVLKKFDFTDINSVVQTDITLPFLDIINGILIDSSGKITLSVGVEIYSSTDDGNTWSNDSNGLEVMTSDDLIFDLQRDPFNVNTLAIATSKGIFISTDSGENWVQKSTDLVFKLGFSTETEGAIVATTYTSEVSEFSLYFSTDSGDSWDTFNNGQLLSISSRSAAYQFYENSVKVYIGSFDLGLLTYTIDFTSLSNPDYDKTNQVMVYPNPVNDVLNIKLQDNASFKVALYNMTGQQMLNADGIEKLDISHLAPGMYLLRVISSSNKVFLKKIIID